MEKKFSPQLRDKIWEWPGDEATEHMDNVSTDGSGEDEGHAEPDWSIEVRVRLDHFCKIVPQWYHPCQQPLCHLRNKRLETLVGCRASQRRHTWAVVTSKKPW